MAIVMYVSDNGAPDEENERFEMLFASDELALAYRAACEAVGYGSVMYCTWEKDETFVALRNAEYIVIEDASEWAHCTDADAFMQFEDNNADFGYGYKGK